MSSEANKKYFLSEAISIANTLIDQADQDAPMFWMTAQIEREVVHWGFNVSLYNGNCGIIAFLAEVYLLTSEPRYLEVAENALRRVLSSPLDFNDTSRFTGSNSLSVTLLRLHRITKLPEYLTKSVEIARSSKMPIQNCPSDLLLGLSGSILHFLDLYDATGEAWLIERMNNCISALISNCQVEKRGISWDSSPNYIRALCGISHGASGVALTFLELYQYFGNQTFLWLADEAMRYESQFINLSWKNWRDLRTGAGRQAVLNEFCTLYRRRKKDAFLTGGDMNAWCHGASGIGLTRLRAFEITRNKKYLKDIYFAISKASSTLSKIGSDTSYTLCHGAGGCAEIFIEAFNIFNKISYRRQFERVALCSIESHKATGKRKSGLLDIFDEPSLFLGNAGIGYFYLRCIDPQVPSVLAPRIAYPGKNRFASKKMKDDFSFDGVVSIIIKKNFPITYKMTSELRFLNGFDSEDIYQPIEKYIKNWIKFIRAYIRSTEPRRIDQLKDIFYLELKRFSWKKSLDSYVRIKVKNEIIRADIEQLEKLSSEQIINISFQRCSDALICKTKWNWHIDEQPSLRTETLEKGEFYLAHRYIGTKSQIVEINLVSVHILNCFRSSKTLLNGINELVESEPALKSNSIHSQTKLRQLAWQLIRVGLLIRSASHF